MERAIRLLCVDDDPYILSSLRRELAELEGCELSTAGGPEEAIRFLETNGPVDVVISDYRMPVMDGATLLGEIQKRWPGMILMILSVHTDSTVFVSSVLKGKISKFLAKPWDDELKDTLTTIMKTIRAKSQKAEKPIPSKKSQRPPQS